MRAYAYIFYMNIILKNRIDAVNGILTVCDSVRRNTKPEVDSAGRSLRDRCIDRGLCIASVQIHKQSVSRLLPGLKPFVSSEMLHCAIIKFGNVIVSLLKNLHLR